MVGREAVRAHRGAEGCNTAVRAGVVGDITEEELSTYDGSDPGSPCSQQWGLVHKQSSVPGGLFWVIRLWVVRLLVIALEARAYEVECKPLKGGMLYEFHRNSRSVKSTFFIFWMVSTFLALDLDGKRYGFEALRDQIRVRTPMASLTVAPSVGISETFSRLKEQGKVALIPYITAGDPDLSTTSEALKVLDYCGSDIIELGMPYSDPLADGPVIQAAATRALAKGTNFDNVISMLREVLLTTPTTPTHRMRSIVEASEGFVYLSCE
ncbi:hypothetical protein QJS04_geneDACA024960 [Acorus gramineus]|uniref:tryptophan synthase n=1 Tax=Acorus gramineus TaxID=55184 RepID=A0AAV8ZZ84_ACOGR|nr:hypothetical protein QJS04_geneDACA024960 [Acorus gramineus]